MSSRKNIRKPAHRTSVADKKSKGFTDGERVAMKERIQEL